MPMVEMIVEMGYFVTISKRSVKIEDVSIDSKILIYIDNDGSPLAEQYGRTTIVKCAGSNKVEDKIRVALVEFVKWYNMQQR